VREEDEMQGGDGGVEQQPMQMVLRVKHPTSSSLGDEEEAGEGSSRSALSVFKAKEEQIARRKMEVREKVFAHLGRVEEESKRLAFIRQVSWLLVALPPHILETTAPCLVSLSFSFFL
jgi:hypothetical protein